MGSAEAGQGQLRIVDPPPGSVFSVAPELRSQELVLRAEPPPGTTIVTFQINGETVAELSPPDSRAVWALRPGVFELQVSARMNDGSVAVATSTFEVKPR